MQFSVLEILADSHVREEKIGQLRDQDEKRVARDRIHGQPRTANACDDSQLECGRLTAAKE